MTRTAQCPAVVLIPGAFSLYHSLFLTCGCCLQSYCSAPERNPRKHHTLTCMELSLYTPPRKQSLLNQLCALQADARDLSVPAASLLNQAFPVSLGL